MDIPYFMAIRWRVYLIYAVTPSGPDLAGGGHGARLTSGH